MISQTGMSTFYITFSLKNEWGNDWEINRLIIDSMIMCMNMSINLIALFLKILNLNYLFSTF